MVSIITNCYNGEKYLEETIQSVLSQTYTDWEYLLFDNNSTDRSAEIFLSHKDPRFKYYKNDHTVPLGHGRHDALKLVTGDYICFIDSDDLWLPTNLEKQVRIMESNCEIGLVYSDLQNFGIDNTIRKTSTEGYRTLPDIMEHYDLGLSSTMFRRSVIDKHHININKDYDLVADFDLFLRIARVSKCYHIKENLVKYRTHRANLSKISKRGEVEYLDVYNNMRSLMTEKEIKECNKGFQRIKNHYYSYKYRNCIVNREYSTAVKCLFRIKNTRWVFANIWYAFRVLLAGVN